LSCLEKVNARVSYVTTGQDVPEDIEIGQGTALAELIVGEPSTGTGMPDGGVSLPRRRRTSAPASWS